MRDACLVILDIGSTLVAGPTDGPAYRIARRLNLDAEQKSVLHGALMTTNFAGPEHVAAFLRDEFALTRAEVRRVAADVWTAQEDEAVPLVGAREVLAGLVSAGFGLALASNIWLPYLTATRKYFGQFFDEHIPKARQLFSFQEGCAKPSLELLRRVLAASSEPADRCLVVGDSYSEDITPATALGMRTAWLLHRPGNELTHLIRVVNREVPGPSIALESIAELSPETASSVLATPLITRRPPFNDTGVPR